jgi:hypothetical protein
MAFKLTIEESKSRHIMEREKRYDVKVNGTKVDELYYNMTGYRGALMTVHGARMDIGEKGISAWKKEAAALNREARELIASFDDPRRLVASHLTSDGDVRKLTFAMPDDLADSKTIYVRNKDFMAGIELFGVDDLDIGYFDPVDPVPDLKQGELLRRGEFWGNQRMVLGIFATSDPNWAALAIGDVPTITGKITSPNKLEENNLPSNWGLEDLARRLEDDFKENFERVVFMPTDTVIALIAVNCSDVMRADILPGKGIISHTRAVFSPMITSTGQRPDIHLTKQEERIFSEGLRSQGYRVEVDEPEAAVDDMPSP